MMQTPTPALRSANGMAQQVESAAIQGQNRELRGDSMSGASGASGASVQSEDSGAETPVVGPQNSNTSSSKGAEAPKSEQQRRMFWKTKRCRFFGRNMCTNGDNCIFAHGEEELRPSPEVVKVKPCKAFLLTGRCNDSPCKYAHSPEELKNPKAWKLPSATPTSAPAASPMAAPLPTGGLSAPVLPTQLLDAPSPAVGIASAPASALLAERLGEQVGSPSRSVRSSPALPTPLAPGLLPNATQRSQAGLMEMDRDTGLPLTSGNAFKARHMTAGSSSRAREQISAGAGDGRPSFTTDVTSQKIATKVASAMTSFLAKWDFEPEVANYLQGLFDPSSNSADYGGMPGLSGNQQAAYQGYSHQPSLYEPDDNIMSTSDSLNAFFSPPPPETQRLSSQLPGPAGPGAQHLQQQQQQQSPTQMQTQSPSQQQSQSLQSLQSASQLQQQLQRQLQKQRQQQLSLADTQPRQPQQLQQSQQLPQRQPSPPQQQFPAQSPLQRLQHYQHLNSSGGSSQGTSGTSGSLSPTNKQVPTASTLPPAQTEDCAESCSSSFFMAPSGGDAYAPATSTAGCARGLLGTLSEGSLPAWCGGSGLTNTQGARVPPEGPASQGCGRSATADELPGLLAATELKQASPFPMTTLDSLAPYDGKFFTPTLDDFEAVELFYDEDGEGNDSSNNFPGASSSTGNNINNHSNGSSNPTPMSPGSQVSSWRPLSSFSQGLAGGRRRRGFAATMETLPDCDLGEEESKEDGARLLDSQFQSSPAMAAAAPASAPAQAPREVGSPVMRASSGSQATSLQDKHLTGSLRHLYDSLAVKNTFLDLHPEKPASLAPWQHSCTETVLPLPERFIHTEDALPRLVMEETSPANCGK